MSSTFLHLAVKLTIGMRAITTVDQASLPGRYNNGDRGVNNSDQMKKLHTTRNLFLTLLLSILYIFNMCPLYYYKQLIISILTFTRNIGLLLPTKPPK